MRTSLDYDFANKVYDILVSKGGACEISRQAFIYHHCESGYGCEEWRFGGKLGQGGKYRSTTNKVDCYREDETPEINTIISEINTLLGETL
jgi:hypothetical protein